MTETERLIKLALKQMATEGWTGRALEQAEMAEGLPPGIYCATFPEGIQQFIHAFQDWLNGEMQAVLDKDRDFSAAKVREKIFRCCMARFDILLPYREAVRRLMAHQLLPWNSPLALRDLGCAADAMWKAAGDRSTDYNYYTKRMLLAGVYAATMTVWLDDSSPHFSETQKFLRARIENVLMIGKAIGGVRERFKKAA